MTAALIVSSLLLVGLTVNFSRPVTRLAAWLATLTAVAIALTVWASALRGSFASASTFGAFDVDPLQGQPAVGVWLAVISVFIAAVGAIALHWGVQDPEVDDVVASSRGDDDGSL